MPFSLKRGYLYLVVFLFLFTGCVREERPAFLSPHISERLKSLLVLPFDYYCPTESSLPFYCPVKGIVPGEILPQAKENMQSLLKEALLTQLGQRYEFRFLEERDYEALLEKVLEQKLPPKEAVKYFAKETGTQGVLYGKIFRYKERKGTSWSVEEPASVAFVLILYDGLTGEILWQRAFDETQKPLSENILNLSLYGKIKWLSARELAERGLKHLLKTFP